MLKHVIKHIKKGLLFGVPAVIVSSIIYSVASFLNDIGTYFYKFDYSIFVYPPIILYFVGIFIIKANKFFSWSERSTNFFAILIRFFNEWAEKNPILGIIYQILRIIFGFDKDDGNSIFIKPVYTPVTDGVYELGLVTHQNVDDTYTIFVPGSPNPTSGKVVIADIKKCKETKGIEIEDVIIRSLTTGKKLIKNES